MKPLCYCLQYYKYVPGIDVIASVIAVYSYSVIFFVPTPRQAASTTTKVPWFMGRRADWRTIDDSLKKRLGRWGRIPPNLQ